MWNFKKNMVVDDVSIVPEQYRGLYVAGTGENAGKHVLVPSAQGLANDYDGVNTVLLDERNKSKNKNTEAAGFRTQLQRFSELAQEMGLTVEEGADLAERIKTHVTELTDQVKGGKEAKINLDNVNRDWTKRLTTAVDTEKGKTTRMQTSLERYLVGQAAAEALAKAGGSPDLLLPHVRSRVKVVQDGEDFIARVLDADGTSIRTGNNGQPMSVADLVAEMKTQPAFAPAFKSEAKGGSGKQPGEGRPAPKTNNNAGGEKSATQKIADGLAKRGLAQ